MLIERIVLASARHASLVIAVTFVLTLVAVLYAANMGRINSDLGNLIKPTSAPPWYTHNEYYKAQFPFFDQTALVVVSGADAAAVDRTARQLASVFSQDDRFHSVFAPGVSDFITDRQHYFMEPEQLDDWLRGIEYSFGPALRLADEASVTNFLFILADHLRANRGLPLPTLLTTGSEQILDSAESEAKALATETGLRLRPRLFNPDVTRHYQLIVLKGRQDMAQQLPNEAIVRQLRQVIDEQALAQDVEVRLTGEVPLAHEEIKAALDGVGLAGAISICLLMLILGFGVRSTGFVAAILFMLTAGVSLTLALAVLFVGAFNTLSLIFVVMFFGLGVDFAVHFGLRVRESLFDHHKFDALKLAAQDVGPALFLCMVTSSIAFLAFVPTDYVGLAELGLISAMGMAVAFLLSITLLPAVFGRINMKSSHRDQFSLAVFSLPPRIVLAGFCLLALLSGWFAKDLSFDYSVLAMRDTETEGMRTLLELQDAGITTDYSISVLASNADEAAAMSASLEQLPAVASVSSPASLTPALQPRKFAQLLPIAERFKTIESVIPPDETDAEMLKVAASYLEESISFAREQDQPFIRALVARAQTLQKPTIAALNQVLTDQLRQQLQELQRVLTISPFTLIDLPSDLKQRLITANGEHLLTVQPAEKLGNRAATTAFIESVAEVAPNYAGRAVVEWGIGTVVVDAFLQAVATALIGILVLLIIYFRNLILPLLVLLPVAMSLLMTFAICQLTGLTLNMANILIVPLIIGLGVDTGIHVVHRARHDVNLIYGSSTSRAVVISALTTIGTFFSLSFSPHQGAASIGLLLTVAISLLVVVTFVMIPTLVKLLKSYHIIR